MRWSLIAIVFATFVKRRTKQYCRAEFGKTINGSREATENDS